MSFGNTTENDALIYLLNGTALSGNWPATNGNFYVALHTADPGEAGAPNASEATYTSYARVAITRNSSGFTVSAATASNTSAVNFPACTGGSNTITYFSVVTSSSGSGGQIIGSGALTASLSVSNGITPSFASGQLTITLD